MPTLDFTRDNDAIAASRLDGLYALATNLPGPLTALDVLQVYKDQGIVEQRHRDLKRPRPLRIRPVFPHNDERIDALIGVVGIALLVRAHRSRPPSPAAHRLTPPARPVVRMLVVSRSRGDGIAAGRPVGRRAANRVSRHREDGARGAVRAPRVRAGRARRGVRTRR